MGSHLPRQEQNDSWARRTGDAAEAAEPNINQEKKKGKTWTVIRKKAGSRP
jgi:hypothetical protein